MPASAEGKPALSNSHVLQGALHHERRLTLLLVSTAIVFGFIGSTIGAFTLGHISGLPGSFALGSFPSHPYLQIYGFIAEFVAGVAYSLLPRFKTGHIKYLPLGYLVYATITSANVLFLLFPFYGETLEQLASFLLLAASSLFAFHATTIALRPSGGFPETNPLFVLSAVSFLLTTFTLLLELEKVGEIFSPEMILLALVGFAGSMIYAVEVRSVSFRQCNYRKRVAMLSWILQGLAVGLTFLAIILSSQALSYAGVLFFLAAAISVILTIRIFEFARPLMYRPAMTKVHFAIVRYNEICLASGSFWLLLGLILGVVSLWGGAGDLFFVRDSFIHSIAIGFVGSSITCFAPMLLPSLLGRKAPVTGLSFLPILLLNAGMLLRFAGDVQTLYRVAPPIWESLSGVLILSAMIALLVVLSRIGKQKIPSVQPKPPFKVSAIEAIRDVRDANLIVIGRRSNREISISVWHAEKDGTIYLLPLHGRLSTWYNNALHNPNIRVSIGGHIFSGRAVNIAGKEEVRKIIKLFKDKYGDRVYRNFYGDGVDCAVALTPDK